MSLWFYKKKYYLLHFMQNLVKGNGSIVCCIFKNTFLKEDKYIYSIKENRRPWEEVTSTL